ncbi:hypothetical protein RND81_05G266600 [Saponaria officinalis]|uniref:Transposase n=1 Tax=Saponaria officinalis TaxID=3572 RepID=A0AAW1L092_SAPOF
MGKGFLTTNEKDSMVHFILANSKKGEPELGIIGDAAAKWGVSRKTAGKWWGRAKEKMALGEPIHLPSHKMGNTNKPRVIINKEAIKAIPKKKRDNMGKLSKQLGIGYGTIQRWVKSGSLKKHTNALHPSLTDANKFQRLIFSLNSTFLDSGDLNVKFKDMSNHVHIDEKWFYLTKTTDTYYILPEEDDPYRSCQSKRFITKVMFMCAVSQPIIDNDGEVIFDGKIGIFPFIEKEPAKRKSKNRAAGVMITKAMDSVTKEVIKACLINKIIPAIKAKWPANACKTIYIQQDNATPHISNKDPDFRVAADSDGFNIKLMFQPPNSPDLNINDLGFFRSIQSLQNEEPANNTEELVAAVEKVYEMHLPSKLNDNFLTLQSVMIEILKCKGHNNFKIPHMRKGVLQREGRLPKDLTVEENLVNECLTYLVQHGYESEIQSLRNELSYNLGDEVLNMV